MNEKYLKTLSHKYIAKEISYSSSAKNVPSE